VLDLLQHLELAHLKKVRVQRTVHK
jgi:hypothetical protein